jgi:mannose-6-phosphate isomerase
MKTTAVAPLLFEPLFRERVWGGRRLETVFGKALPPGKSIGESWEIVDRPEAQSVVRQGEFRGLTLHELWQNRRAEIFGADVLDAPRFPIFAKLLDAREVLSLQVHPPAAIAQELGGEAKTEMWYLAETEPNADLFVGLRRGVSKEQFKHALQTGAAADHVHRIAAKRGDAFFVPSGRLHAIGAGNLIVEIQQNSDTTYRVFDWNRTGTDGRPRPLQIEQAMRSIDFSDVEPEAVRPDGELLVRSPDFTVEKWDLTEARPALDGLQGGALFVCLGGAAEMANISLQPGDFFLAPATAAGTKITPRAPATSLLRVTLPTR